MLTISGWKLRQNGPIRLESGLEIIFFRGTTWETENIVKGRDKSELNSAYYQLYFLNCTVLKSC